MCASTTQEVEPGDLTASGQTVYFRGVCRAAKSEGAVRNQCFGIRSSGTDVVLRILGLRPCIMVHLWTHLRQCHPIAPPLCQFPPEKTLACHRGEG